jgi:transposase
LEDLLQMNQKERERLKTIIRLEEGSLNQCIAAKQLKIGVRQLQRLVREYRINGEKALISKKRGRQSNNSLSDLVRKKIATTISQNYSDFGPTLAHEKLAEKHGIITSVSSVRNIMIENKIWVPRKAKTINKIHQRRQPRQCYGELIQMDGSYHDWFEGRAPECCLIVVIDDATSRLMWLQFVEWESCFSYFQAIKEYIKNYGKPMSVYTDRLAVFETTRKTDKNYKDTQVHRALSMLGIELILARSPQAKGRVERVNGTLQDRLIKEMRLAHISSMEEGNAFLPSYIEKHNKKFAKKPMSSINAHTNIKIDSTLENILCLHHQRKITKDLTVSFAGVTYQILEPNCQHRLSGKKVLIKEKEGENLEFFYNEKLLNYKIYQELPRENIHKEKNLTVDFQEPQVGKGKHRGYHPWRGTKKKVVGF